MANYKEVRGTKIRDYTTNPDNPIEGQVWYNETDNVAKYEVPNVTTAWRTGPDDVSPTPRFYTADHGSSTSALSATGESPSSPVYRSEGETWNGTAFTATPTVNQGRYGAMGYGDASSGGIAAGYHSPPASNQVKHELWNGSSWTETTDINTARRFPFGSGATDAALLSGGFGPPDSALCESWNGTAWTEVADLNKARYFARQFGTYTAAIAAAGYAAADPGAVAVTESWNGSAWTEVNDTNAAKYAMGGGGTQTSGLIFGGYDDPVSQQTESWDGTSWTEIADMSQGRQGLSGGATNNTAAIAYLGHTPPGQSGSVNFSEELTVGQAVGAWSTDTALNTGRFSAAGSPAGTSTASLLAGGQVNPGANVQTVTES